MLFLTHFKFVNKIVHLVFLCFILFQFLHVFFIYIKYYYSLEIMLLEEKYRESINIYLRVSVEIFCESSKIVVEKPTL